MLNKDWYSKRRSNLPMRLNRVTMLKVSLNNLKVKGKGKHVELHKILIRKKKADELFEQDKLLLFLPF